MIPILFFRLRKAKHNKSDHVTNIGDASSLRSLCQQPCIVAMAFGALTCASASRRSALVSCLHHFALEAAVAEGLQIDSQVPTNSSREGRALALLALEL